MAPLSPDDAAHTLDEVNRTRAEALRAVKPVPVWYLISLAVFVGGTHMAINAPPLVAIPVIAALLVMLAVTITALYRKCLVRVHRSLWRWYSVLTLVGWGAGLSLVTGFGLGFSLWAADVDGAFAIAGAVEIVTMTVSAFPVARAIQRMMVAEAERGRAGDCS